MARFSPSGTSYFGRTRVTMGNMLRNASTVDAPGKVIAG
ncbi:hypothetical protein J2T12_001704 [Paenibacillus anaericanus]|nr:hypothetical protein [Paenibacillus anaericanus]